MRFIYSPDQLAWLRENYPLMGVPALTAAFNNEFFTSKTASQIKSTLKNHNITCGRTAGQLNKGKYIYTAEQLDWLRENYPHQQMSELTQDFNAVFDTLATAAAVKATCGRFKIRSGRTGYFPAGHVPANKGTRGLTSRNRTTFVQGQRPGNWRPIGSERIAGGYLTRKMTDTGITRIDYVPVHHLVWEAANGPLPVGQNVIFIDGDRTNITQDNLQDVSRGELGVLNKLGFSSLPLELRRTFIATVKLQVAANKIQRERT